MAPRGHTSRRGPFGLHLHPVRTWWPGKGTPFSAPSVRMFYTSKVRAKLGWWQAERASRAVVQCLQHGYKLQFDTPPPPFKTSPLLVDAKDVDFALQDLQQGTHLARTSRCCQAGTSFFQGLVYTDNQMTSSAQCTTTDVSIRMLAKQLAATRAYAMRCACFARSQSLSVKLRLRESVLEHPSTQEDCSFSVIPFCTARACSVGKWRHPIYPSSAGSILGGCSGKPGALSSRGALMRCPSLRVHKFPVGLDQGHQGARPCYAGSRYQVSVVPRRLSAVSALQGRRVSS